MEQILITIMNIFGKMFNAFFNLNIGFDLKLGYILIASLLLNFGKDIINLLAKWRNKHD